MSLLGTIQLSSNALNAAQLGLQVTGNNIANANTPDYIRERLVQSTQPGYPLGGLVVGLGVKIDGVQQVIDKFLDERMRHATSDVANSNAQADAYSKLESVINELGDNDLSTSLTSFFGSLQDVLNQPESTAIRNVAVQKAQTLTQSIQRLDSQTRQLHQDFNTQIVSTASDINSLLKDVAQLNVKIASVEGGVSKSDAVGLRDQRAADLNKLAEITDIRTIEQPAGDVTVYSGGDYLVSLGTYRKVHAVTESQGNLQVSRIEIEGINSPLSNGGGRLAGLTAARDNVLGGFLSGLGDVSKTLINEFNKVYSGGQGLSGYSQLTSEHSVSANNSPLDVAGLPFTPTNGGFQVQVTNKLTGETKTTDVRVDLNGLDTDTNLETLTSQLNAIDGISATITTDGKLQITSDSPETTFAFNNDTSGTLAAFGLNTFFTGAGSQDIGVNADLKADPGKLAFSGGGVGQDTKNGEQLANLLTAPLATHDGKSLADIYEQVTSDVATGSQSASAAAAGFTSFQQALESQHLAVSGVNIDEEAVHMIEYQRAFQASAKVITTINDLLDTLLKL
jgi:flagellar hook-associated protein 1 FlgK